MRILLGLTLGLLLAACDRPSGAQADTGPALPREPNMLKTYDGTSIAGWLYKAAKPKAVVLLFHQAGSSKDEYGTIAPRLAAMGYTAYAIDQRSGGDLFGDNSTVHRTGKSTDFLSARQDLEAALGWARTQGLPVILWGSSYSAALVFEVAADNPASVDAVMAFSPGEYLGDGNPVTKAAARLHVPVFVTSAKDPKEIEAAKAILAAVPGPRKVQYVPDAGGTHGSSTLIKDKDPAGYDANWRAVEAFLRQVAPTS
ncbi:alpha/beta hydrolase [Sphingomonas sp.]|uniref:alpha/beta hydrolase n=1 Tax=Sphingomonas sp. TaxID=28214 RepID=UPI0025D49D71|nr:alpha/beta hydrolase [Sphingomonas sp.]